MTDYQGKYTMIGEALITGASSGIGAVYADRLAKRGHDLILVARRRERLDALATRLIEETGRSVQVLVADLTDEADLARVEDVLRTDTGIGVLVNNAGTSMGGDLAEGDRGQLKDLIQLNVTAPTLLARAAVPGFLDRGRGTIINISSVLALAPEIFNAAYSGTKAYLLNLSLRLQKEIAGKGGRVQAVLPGATRTDIWEKTGADIESFPPEMVMDVYEMVDAALAGLDQGETVTIPSLPNIADWDSFEAARLNMGANLSRASPAARYRLSGSRPE